MTVEVFIFSGMSELNQSLTRPLFFILRLVNWLLHFTLLSFLAKESFKAKNIKAASIRKDHITVKVKMLYVKGKFYKRKSHLFNKINHITNIIYYSIYVPSNINIYIKVWVPS